MRDTNRAILWAIVAVVCALVNIGIALWALVRAWS